MKRGIIFALIGVLVLGVVVVLVTALFGGKKSTKTDNTLTIWSPFDEETTFKTISEKYLADNPTVTLSYRYVQATDAKDYEAKVVDAIANGKGPDIWLIRTDWLPKHQAKLIPSTSYVSWSKDKKNEKEAAEQFFGTNVADQNMRDGKLYGFPLSVDSLALYINTKVVRDTQNRLDAANNADASKLSTNPATWNDVVAWSRLLTTKDSKGTPTTSGIALGTTTNSYAPVDIYLAMLSQYGGSLYTDDEKGVGIHLIKVVNNQNVTPGVQALTLFSSFARTDDPNYTWNSGLGDPVKAFVGGQLGMMIGYSTVSKDIQKLDKSFDSVKIVPLPQVDDPATSGKRVDGANYWTLVVSKTSNKPSTAWTYLKALSTTGAQKYNQLTKKPSLAQAKDASARISSIGLSDSGLFAQQVSFATIAYKPEWQAVDETLQDMINQTLLPNQSIQASIDSAAERLKALLSTNG